MGRVFRAGAPHGAAPSLHGQARLRRCGQTKDLSKNLPVGSCASLVGHEVGMAERETKREPLGPVTLSVLDRLLDHEPKSKVEGPLTHSKSLAALKVAIRRDLENQIGRASCRERVEISVVAVSLKK